MTTPAGAALLLALLAQPALEVEAPSPSVRGTLRTSIFVGERSFYEGTALRPRRFAPIVQDVLLDADTGVPGLTVALDFWAGVDAGDRFFSAPALAEITEAWVRWHARYLTLRAGRLHLYSELGRGERVDGAHVAIHPRWRPFDVAIELWAGLPVNPLAGEDPLLLARDAQLPDDPLAVARGLADWRREGDLAAGAFLRLAKPGLVELGAGYTRVTNLGEVDREALAARADLDLGPRFSATLRGSYDLHARGLEDAELIVEAWPHRALRAAAYGRSYEPSLLLPSTSILSVFVAEGHRDAGLEADLFLARRFRLSAQGELRFVTGTDEPGYRLLAAARGKIGGGARGTLSYERLAVRTSGGYDHARLGLEVPLGEQFTASADAAAFFVDRGDDRPSGASATRRALRGTAALTYAPGPELRVVVSARLTGGEDVARELAVIGRLEWNVESRF